MPSKFFNLIWFALLCGMADEATAIASEDYYFTLNVGSIDGLSTGTSPGSDVMHYIGGYSAAVELGRQFPDFRLAAEYYQGRNEASHVAREGNPVLAYDGYMLCAHYC